MKTEKTLLIGVLAFMTLIFIFGAGEETSCGQRILNVQTSEFFEQHNAQGEMNLHLHNLRVNGVKINKLILPRAWGMRSCYTWRC